MNVWAVSCFLSLAESTSWRDSRLLHSDAYKTSTIHRMPAKIADYLLRQCSNLTQCLMRSKKVDYLPLGNKYQCPISTLCILSGSLQLLPQLVAPNITHFEYIWETFHSIEPVIILRFMDLFSHHLSRLVLLHLPFFEKDFFPFLLSTPELTYLHLYVREQDQDNCISDHPSPPFFKAFLRCLAEVDPLSNNMVTTPNLGVLLLGAPQTYSPTAVNAMIEPRVRHSSLQVVDLQGGAESVVSSYENAFRDMGLDAYKIPLPSRYRGLGVLDRYSIRIHTNHLSRCPSTIGGMAEEWTDASFMNEDLQWIHGSYRSLWATFIFDSCPYTYSFSLLTDYFSVSHMHSPLIFASLILSLIWSWLAAFPNCASD